MTLEEARILTLRVLKQVMEEKLDHHNVQLAQVRRPIPFHSIPSRTRPALFLFRPPSSSSLPSIRSELIARFLILGHTRGLRDTGRGQAEGGHRRDVTISVESGNVHCNACSTFDVFFLSSLDLIGPALSNDIAPSTPTTPCAPVNVLIRISFPTAS